MSSTRPRKLPHISDLPPDEVTPSVVFLLEICHELREENQVLRDEIALLKGQKPKPKIKPSQLESRGKTKQRNKRGRRALRSDCSFVHLVSVSPRPCNPTVAQGLQGRSRRAATRAADAATPLPTSRRPAAKTRFRSGSTSSIESFTIPLCSGMS